MPETVIDIKPPYLLFIGNEPKVHFAKTGAGLAYWRPELCVGQIRLSADTADLGLPDLSIAEARERGVGSLIIGVAPLGGKLPESWLDTLELAALAGIDIVAGLHSRLTAIPRLQAAAKKGGARLTDVRVPPADLPVGTGRKRSGFRLLTVGTDCALGKKYTALQIEAEMRSAGVKATFRATGQTGIMIAGRGIPMDAVVSDFISGAAEVLSPDNEADHWDIIEGQGSLYHPGFSAVTLGLLIGSQPDAFVVCHEVNRDRIEDAPEFPTPSIGELIDRTVALGRMTNPGIRCVGISVNTSSLSATARQDYLKNTANKYGLPCIDPVATGAAAIVDYVRQQYR